MSGHEEQYLIRWANGRMTTVVARSLRGAVRTHLRSKNRPKKGDTIHVKPRGRGDWTEFRIY